MKISKKILSMIMVLLLIVGIVPTSVITAFAADTHKHCVCGGNTDIGDHTAHSDIAFTEWTSTDSMPDTAGNYVLMNNVTISSGWKPAEGETVLCLNGYDLVYDGEKTGSTIQFEQNRTLTLCDCKGIGKITHAEGSYGRGVNVGALNSLFIMYGGNICGNNARGHAGGGVQVSLNMIMYGGTISDNVSNFQGGGVDIGFVGTLTMYGGTIESNSTSGSGGGVHVSGNDSNRGTLIMLGGSITDNAAQKGGGVMLSAGDDYYANITVGGNAIIKNNTADAEPNNLYLHYSEGRQQQQLVTIQNMTDGAEIGITMDSGKEGVFSTGGKDFASSFFSDNGAYAVAVDGENLKLVEAYVQVGQVTLKNGEYTTDGESTTTTKPESGGYAHFENGVLTLNNFTYYGNGGNGAVIYSTSDLTINAVGTNTINSDEKYAIYLKGGDLTIEGDVLNLAVRDAEKALTTVFLYDDTYGKLNITDITLNIDNNGDDQTYGIRCEDVLIDGSTLNVTMKKERQHRGTGLDASGTVAIKRNSQVVIDLSEVTNGTALIADENVSVSDSYVELRGDANGGTGLSFNTSYKTLDFDGGTLIIAGTRDPGGAIYMYSATIELPDGDYWWRTDENGSYTKTGYVYSKDHTYIELTTTDPHICEWDTKWSSDENAHWHECLTAGCPISDNAQKDEYGLHNPNADDGDCSTAVTCAVCEAVTTAAKSHSFTELSTELASEGDCQNPKTYYAKCANCDEISNTVTVASSEYGNHKWEADWTTDSEKHWHKCLNTGCTEIKDDNLHSGGSATCKDLAKCEFCDMAYGDTDGDNHRYSASLTWTDDEHFYECSLCSAKKDKALHDFTDDCDKTCNTCEYVRVITHAFDKLEKDSDGHWYICSVCGVEAPEGKEAHSGGTATCTAKAKCEVCDAEYGDVLLHDYELNCDEDEHWYFCSVCSTEKPNSREAHKGGTATCTAKAKCEVCETEYGAMTDHVYENGKCKVCGVADPKYVPDSPQTGDSGVMHLWVIMAVSALGIVAVFGFGRKRRAN